MKTNYAEADIRDLLPFALILGVTGIGIAFVQNIMSDVGGDFTAGSLEANSTTSAQTGVDNLAKKLPLVGTVLIAVVIIGLVVGGLFIQFRR